MLSTNAILQCSLSAIAFFGYCLYVVFFHCISLVIKISASKNEKSKVREDAWLSFVLEWNDKRVGAGESKYTFDEIKRIYGQASLSTCKSGSAEMKKRIRCQVQDTLLPRAISHDPINF